MYVGSYKFGTDIVLFQEILKYAKSKKVTLFTRLHPDNQPVYNVLSQMNNVTLIASRYFHAKFIIRKNEEIITTANFISVHLPPQIVVRKHYKNILKLSTNLKKLKAKRKSVKTHFIKKNRR